MVLVCGIFENIVGSQSHWLRIVIHIIYGYKFPEVIWFSKMDRMLNNPGIKLR